MERGLLNGSCKPQQAVLAALATAAVPVTAALQELPELWLVNVYVPNSGEGLRRLDYRTQQWDKAFAQFLKVSITSCLYTRYSPRCCCTSMCVLVAW